MTFLNLSLDWSGVGAIITAAIATVALLIALRELRVGREATVQEIYKEFLIQSLQYPRFICPDETLVNPDKQLFNGHVDTFWQYEVYVDLMLTAFEELFYLPHDDKLKNYLGGYLYSHKTYLSSEYFKKNFVVEMDKEFWDFATNALLVEERKWK
jgi:hypothetical protein